MERKKWIFVKEAVGKGKDKATVIVVGVGIALGAPTFESSKVEAQRVESPSPIHQTIVYPPSRSRDEMTEEIRRRQAEIQQLGEERRRVLDERRKDIEDGSWRTKWKKPEPEHEPARTANLPPREQMRRRDSELNREIRVTTSSMLWLPERVKRYSHLFDKYGIQYRVEPDFLKIIAIIENGDGHPDGLMQVDPDTAKMVAARIRLERYDRTKPEDSVHLAAGYISNIMDDLGISKIHAATVPVLAVAYNGGRQLSEKYLKYEEFVSRQKLAHCYRKVVSGLWDERFLSESKTLKNIAGTYKECR